MFDSQRHLEGRKFCVVFVQVVDELERRVRLQCFRGRANIDGPKIHCVRDDGRSFTVPASACGNILPSDGTPLLGDAEYFVLVKTDPKISLQSHDTIFYEDDEITAAPTAQEPS